jgi:hypothetical protein
MFFTDPPKKMTMIICWYFINSGSILFVVLSDLVAPAWNAAALFRVFYSHIVLLVDQYHSFIEGTN